MRMPAESPVVSGTVITTTGSTVADDAPPKTSSSR